MRGGAPDVPGKTWGVTFSDASDFMMATDQRGRIIVSRQTWPNAGGFCPQRDLAEALRNIGSEIPITQNQEYALECLWHEAIHNKQVVAHIEYGSLEQILMETANQWISRRTYWQLSDRMPGWKPDHEDWVKDNGYG